MKNKTIVFSVVGIIVGLIVIGLIIGLFIYFKNKPSPSPPEPPPPPPPSSPIFPFYNFLDKLPDGGISNLVLLSIAETQSNYISAINQDYFAIVPDSDESSTSQQLFLIQKDSNGNPSLLWWDTPNNQPGDIFFTTLVGAQVLYEEISPISGQQGNPVTIVSSDNTPCDYLGLIVPDNTGTQTNMYLTVVALTNDLILQQNESSNIVLFAVWTPQQSTCQNIPNVFVTDTGLISSYNPS